MSSGPEIDTEVTVPVFGACSIQIQLILVKVNLFNARASTGLCSCFRDRVSIVAIDVDEVRSTIEDFPALLLEDEEFQVVRSWENKVKEGQQF